MVCVRAGADVAVDSKKSLASFSMDGVASDIFEEGWKSE